MSKKRKTKIWYYVVFFFCVGLRSSSSFSACIRNDCKLRKSSDRLFVLLILNCADTLPTHRNIAKRKFQEQAYPFYLLCETKKKKNNAEKENTKIHGMTHTIVINYMKDKLFVLLISDYFIRRASNYYICQLIVKFESTWHINFAKKKNKQTPRCNVAQLNENNNETKKVLRIINL